MAGSGTAPAKKVMVVADPTRESAIALQYALSHAVLEQDELILLHVQNLGSWRYTFSTFLKRPSLGSSTTTTLDIGGGGGGEAAAGTGAGAGAAGAVAAGAGAREMDFLEEMKLASQVAQPKIQVRTMRVDMDGKEKANIILSQSKLQGVDAIVIGQRRSLSTALGFRRSGGPTKGTKVIDTVEYLIENSTCTCVAVQRKGQKAGYVLNSKTHRNFWLLA